MHVLPKLDLLVVLFGSAHYRSPHRHVVAAVELGGGGDHHVAPKLQGLHEHRGRESGVTHVHRTNLFGELGERGHVSEHHGGVGWGLAEEHFGDPGPARRLHRRHVGEVAKRHLHLVLFGEEEAGGAVGAPVGAVGDDHVVARVQKRRHHRHGGGHASTEHGRTRAISLQLGHLGGQDLHGWVFGPAVRVALRKVPINGRLYEGRGLVDRGEYGPRLFVRINSMMYGASGKSKVALDPCSRERTRWCSFLCRHF
mmetsp:Transcript_5068/g.9650  ORF Transcript_5068/g.9650 Transcript_5068/m.9650 type:complete len:254 (-) Transcript_5068:32-793(-)